MIEPRYKNTDKNEIVTWLQKICSYTQFMLKEYHDQNTKYRQIAYSEYNAYYLEQKSSYISVEEWQVIVSAIGFNKIKRFTVNGNHVGKRLWWRGNKKDPFSYPMRGELTFSMTFSTTMFNYMCIHKLDDDWFLLYMRNTVPLDFYYLCDQIEGVESCIKHMKKARFWR